MATIKQVSKVSLAVLSLAAVATGSYLVGVNQGVASAGENLVLDKRNPFCMRLTEGFGYTFPGAEESDRIACEVVGMSESAATHYIETRDRTWRIASRNGESFPLTADYSPTRIDLEIQFHIVVAAISG